MSKNTENLFSNTKFKLLLQLLRADTSKAKAIHELVHPREWIPPPCLTSLPQDNHLKLKKHRRFLDVHTSSSDEMDGVSKFERTQKPIRKKESSSMEGKEEIARRLKHLKRDQELLRESQLKLHYGEGLPSLNDIVHKWRTLDEKTLKKIESHAHKLVVSDSAGRQTSTESRAHKLVVSDSAGRQTSTKLDSESGLRSVDGKKNETTLKDLEKKFRQAKEEEELLKTKLKRLKKEEKKSKENKRPTVKLKKNSNSEYKILALKRRYEDLLQYLARLESKNKELKKENEVLHVTLKEENEFPARERIFSLEEELLTRNKEFETVTSHLNDLKTIEQENASLKKIVNSLKKREEEQEEERQLKEEEFERGWIKKATDMKVLYERAVQGYKEQLMESRSSCEALEERLRSLIQYYEKDEKDLIERYEREIKALKLEINPSQISVSKDQETIGLLKLETLLEKRDREIMMLKESLIELQATQKEDMSEQLHKSSEEFHKTSEEFHKTSEEFQKEVLEKLSEIVNKSTVVDDNCLESIKDVVKRTFEDFSLLKSKNETTVNKHEHLSKENESLKEELRDKINEVNFLRKNFDLAERNWEKLLSKRVQDQKEKNVEGKTDLDINVLKEFPLLLKESEAKLRNSEVSCHKYQTEVKLFQERLRHATVDSEAKKERISELEVRIKDLMVSNKKLERENEKLESKIEILETQIEKKNRILEKNSSQIEERIREYRSLVSQMERLRDEHSKEISTLKLNQQILQTDPKLQEAQNFNVRLEAQLSALKTEKTMEEKMAKKQIRTLEEQTSQLKIRNATLQKHLQTIQDTYKSMFGLEGNLIPFLTLPNSSAFQNREMHSEMNNPHSK